ncbi:MAG: hypothetical protein ACW98F_04485 [Candidatus Hodarchaeales archaeon]|jgi:hypothetical protein
MTAIETDVAQCNGCGAPLYGKPTSIRPIQCEYCDLTNYLKKSQIMAPDENSVDEEVESEHYYILYQESQRILENFPGELVGEEVGKIRIKMQVGQYAFPLLIVLDDLPDKPFIDGPNVLREVINCEIRDLNSMKNWVPGTSSVLDVLEEIYHLTEKQIPKKLESSSTTVEVRDTIKEKDPLIRQILESYDATSTKKEIKINFYAQTGEIIPFTIKRKKNYPIGLESEVLSRYPLIRGPLEDYAKGRVDLVTVLAEIERLFYV